MELLSLDLTADPVDEDLDAEEIGAAVDGLARTLVDQRRREDANLQFALEALGRALRRPRVDAIRSRNNRGPHRRGGRAPRSSRRAAGARPARGRPRKPSATGGEDVPPAERACGFCGSPLPSRQLGQRGRKRRYCNARCRKAAHNRRHAFDDFYDWVGDHVARLIGAGQIDLEEALMLRSGDSGRRLHTAIICRAFDDLGNDLDLPAPVAAIAYAVGASPRLLNTIRAAA